MWARVSGWRDEEVRGFERVGFRAQRGEELRGFEFGGLLYDFGFRV